MSELQDGANRQATLVDVFRFADSVEVILEEVEPSYYQTMRFTSGAGEVSLTTIQGSLHDPRDLITVQANGKSLLELNFDNDTLGTTYFPPQTTDRGQLIEAVTSVVDGVIQNEEHGLTGFEKELFQDIARIAISVLQGDDDISPIICEQVANGARATMSARSEVAVCAREEARKLDDRRLVAVRSQEYTNGEGLQTANGLLPYLQYEVTDDTDSGETVEIVSMWDDGSIDYRTGADAQDERKIIREFDDTEIKTVDAAKLERVVTILTCWLQTSWPDEKPIFYAPTN